MFEHSEEAKKQARWIADVAAKVVGMVKGYNDPEYWHIYYGFYYQALYGNRKE